VTEKKKKIVIIDARSYTAAWANRAKGGGFESGEAYNSTEVLFMSLPNIHSLRYSFHQLRNLLHSNVDGTSSFQSLNAANWFQYLSNLIVSTQRCIEALCQEGLSVLVHCSGNHLS
jgi:myotubularin-related protein 3/4